MNKRILTVILAVLFTLTSLPAVVLGQEQIALNEVFENYPANSASMGAVKVVTGIDGRVIKEANGNKAAYTKAWGESGKITASFTAPDATNMVYSAKIKLSGANTSGKLLTLSGSGNSSLSLLNLADNGSVTIPGGKHIGGAPKGRWVTYTFVIDWEKNMMDVYVDGKCRDAKIYLPTGSYLNMNTMTFAISEPEGKYAELLLDELRVYEGRTLPEKMSFPSVPNNNEMVEFEETKTLDIAPTIHYNNDFTSGVGSIAIDGGGGKIKHTKEVENGFLNLAADEATTSNAYFDISVPNLAEVQKYVLSYDFKVNKITGAARVTLFDGKNIAAAWRMGLYISESGIYDGATNKQIFSYTKGKWYNVSLCYNIGESTCDIYLDGELYKKGHSVGSISPVTFRVDAKNSVGSALDVNLDNIRFYNGRKPMTEEEYNTLMFGSALSDDVAGDVSVVDYTAEAISCIDKSTVFMLTNNKMFVGGRKIDYPQGYTPQVVDGVFMITPDVLSAAGVSAVYDATSGSIDIENGKAKINVGSDILVTKGKEIKMPKAAYVENGTAYVPMSSIFVDVLGKKLYDDARGFIVIHDGSFTYTDSTIPQEALEPIDSVFKYMQFENPRAPQILSDIDKTIGNARPRVIFTPDDVNYILDKIDSGDTTWNRVYQEAITNANRSVGKVTASSLADNKKQDTASGFATRMEYHAIAYMLTGDDKYAETAVENMIAVCSWDTLGEKVSQLAAGDWMLGMAYGYDAFYSYLLQHEKEFTFIKENIRRLAIDPIVNGYKGKNKDIRWIKMVDNFNGFVGGGAVMLCLALAGEEEFKDDCGYLLENLLKTLEIYVSIFEPDGAWYEGVSYGYYGLFHTADAFMALKNCCGTDYGMSSGKGMRSAADWYIYASTPQSSFTFHDMRADTVTKTWCGFYLSYLNGDVERMEATRRFLSLTDTSITLRPLFYYEKAITNKEIKVNLDNLSLDHYFDSADVGTFYNTLAIEKPTFAAFHGGWNGLYHDMLDLGCFMFISDGVVWAYDMGADNYSLPNYFGVSG